MCFSETHTACSSSSTAQPKPLARGDVQVDATMLGAVLTSAISRCYLSMLESDTPVTLSSYILCFPLKSSNGAKLNSAQGRPGYLSKSKMEPCLSQVIEKYLYLFSTMSIVYFFALPVIQRMVT